jgi:hypothetical protein
MPFGKGTQRETIQFNITAESYSMLDTVRLTKITMR